MDGTTNQKFTLKNDVKNEYVLIDGIRIIANYYKCFERPLSLKYATKLSLLEFLFSGIIFTITNLD